MEPVSPQGEGEQLVSNEDDTQFSTCEDDSVGGDSGGSSSDDDDSDETDEDGNDQVGPMMSESDEKYNILSELELAEAGIQPRGQQAKLRASASMHPRSSSQRRRSNLRKRMLGNFLSDKEPEIENTNRRPVPLHGHGHLMVQDIEHGRQYRLTATRPQVRCITRIKNWFGFGMSTVAHDNKKRYGLGIFVNEMLMKYLRWTNRSSFVAVILSAAVGFLVLTVGFAFLIWRVGHRHPECIGGIDFDTDYFADAFALSWTTFRYVLSMPLLYRNFQCFRLSPCSYIQHLTIFSSHKAPLVMALFTQESLRINPKL